MDILKLARSFTTEDGVTLYMLPYRTTMLTRVGKMMRAAVGVTREDGTTSLTEEEATYVMCAPITVGIDLPPNPPAWAVILKDFLKDKTYLSDPVTRWYELATIAPEMLFTQWWAAQKGTRPVELMAATEVQQGAPETDGEEISGPTQHGGAA